MTKQWTPILVCFSNSAGITNNVAPSPTSIGKSQNSDTGQSQQNTATALHQVLCAESVAEKERKISEIILQLQLYREKLLQEQHDQSKVRNFLSLIWRRSLKHLGNVYKNVTCVSERYCLWNWRVLFVFSVMWKIGSAIFYLNGKSWLYFIARFIIFTRSWGYGIFIIFIQV